MADIKQILHQGANVEYVVDPFVVSTGRAFTKSELRAEGVDVDNIAKYANLSETSHVFCTFSGDQQLNVCKLTLRAYLFDENANDNDIIQTFNVEITKVLVSEVINEIAAGLANNGLVDFLVELRNSRLQITARRAQAHIRVGELQILDSRGDANAESVNDLSNPHRLFDYFWPDARGISRHLDLMPAPARERSVTSQSVGVSQGEPRTSASLNRGLTRHADVIDRTSLYAEFDNARPRRVRIPLELTEDSIDLTVDYSANPSPAAIWSSTFMLDPAGQPPGVIIEPRPRRGGSSSDLPHTVSVLALRGISIPTTGLPLNNAKIVTSDGRPIGLVSPDSRFRGGSGSLHDTTPLDYGVPFISDTSRWRVVKSPVQMTEHPLILYPLPLTQYLAFPEGAPLIDEAQFEILGEEAEIATSFTRIDEVTLELDVPVAARYRWARVRLAGSDRSLIVREWVTDRRVIVSEVPDELRTTGHYVFSARLEDLEDVDEVLISRGIAVNPNEWLFISVLGTAGPLGWIHSEDVFLEIDVSNAPKFVGGVPTIFDVNSSEALDLNRAVVRASSPFARTIEESGCYTLKGAHESGIGGMSLRHSTGTPYDTDTFNELLTRPLARLMNGPNARAVHDSLSGLMLQQLSESSPTLVYEQAGVNVTVDLSEATSFYLGDDYTDGIDFFLYDKFRVTQGDVRYDILRRLTLRFASGTFAQDVRIYPETQALTIQSETLATDLLSGTGFRDEHIGLALLVLNYTDRPILITITSVETQWSARYKYLDTSLLYSGMIEGQVDLKLAPLHLIDDMAIRGDTPALKIDGLDTISDRVSGPPAIELQGARPLESYYNLGDWMSRIVPAGQRAFIIIEVDGNKYAQIPFTQDNTPLSIDQVHVETNERMKIREDMHVTSLGGRYWQSGGLFEPGNYPDFILINDAHENSTHHIDFYYRISSPGDSSSLVFPPFKVESRDVYVVIQEGGNQNFIYGLLIPVPDYAISLLDLRGAQREALASNSIEVMKKQVSFNKDQAYIDKGYLDRPSVLNELNIYGATGYVAPRVEMVAHMDYDETTTRPSGNAVARSEVYSSFGNMPSSSARIEARQEYQDRTSANDNVVAVSEMSLRGGPGNIGLTANHRYDQESDEYLTMLTTYGSSESASLTNDGVYATNPEARCEDVSYIPGQGELTGFDHKHLSGDMTINTESVKKLSEELDAMKQREFGILRQLSLLSASAHETLDMLRTANSTIRSMRNVQYELAMALLAVMDIRANDIINDEGNNSIRDMLRQRAGQGGLEQSIPHRLMKALHFTGHLVASDLDYNVSLSDSSLVDLGQLFEGITHTSANSINFFDDIPLDYERPGYARLRSIQVLGFDPYVNQNGPLDPTSDVLRPTVYNPNGFKHLYVKSGYVGREDRSKENFSWTAAIQEMKTLVQESAEKAISDFGSLVSRVSPMFSFRARADFANIEDIFTIGNNGNPIDNDEFIVCMYLMGVGYWSPTSVGHSTLSMHRSYKADPAQSGWYCTTTTTRRVGPEQVATSSEVFEYVENYRADNLNYNLSRATDALGSNAIVYTDNYILDQVTQGRDLIVGVTQNPQTGGFWSITQASLPGYPDLFPYSIIFTPQGFNTRVYESFEDAKWGTELFYCVDIDEESPRQTIPSVWHGDPDNGYALKVSMVGGYGNEQSDIPLDLGSAPVPRLTTHKVVYCRAWCVARAESTAALRARLDILGYQEDDIRINSPILVGPDEWVALRTRVGMSDFLKQLEGEYAAPGQVLFSFNKSGAGKYLNSSSLVKTSQDPV